MHETGNRSVQLVARNHEARTKVKSFVHRDARYEGIGESRIGVESFVHQDARRYEGIVNYAPRLNLSCIKMHVTRKSVNHVPWLNHSCYEGIANHVSEFIIRATSCTLRGNRESRTEVESFVHRDARYEGILNHVSGLNYSCNKLHATRELVNRIPRLNLSCNKLHATGHRITHYRYE